MPSKRKKEWQKNTLGPAVDRVPERQQEFQTDSGLEIESLYSEEDLTAAGITLPELPQRAGLVLAWQQPTSRLLVRM